jgi:prepilin-type N-terminal cleavage/methylation domain-containing protein
MRSDPQRRGNAAGEQDKKSGADSGFTLIELVVVIAVIALLFMIAVPRLSRIMSTQRENFALFTGMAAQTFDDAFLKSRTNFFTIYLNGPDPEDAAAQKDTSNRRNGIGVQVHENGEFVDSKRKSLRYKDFSNSFLLEEVITPSGEKITNGNVLVPFYPQGYSRGCIVHILVKDEQRWSVIIDKHMKEPKVVEGYVTFDTER